jgi:large subunit ribosomal protein L24
MFNAPAHIRHKLMSAHLAPDLVKSHGAKSLPVRKGDTVRIMRGDHQGFEGKISTVDLANFRIFLEGLTREKVDGTVIFVPVHPSKVLIKSLNLDDKWRKRTLQRKQPLKIREESGLVVKPAEEEAKPIKKEAKPKAAKAKAKREAKPKAEKPAKAKPEVSEVEEKTEVLEEKPVVKRPRAAKKAAETKVVEEKPAAKPTRKRAQKATKEAAPPEEKPVEAKGSTEKPAKKATTKKAPTKMKPKSAEEKGGA